MLPKPLLQASLQQLPSQRPQPLSLQSAPLQQSLPLQPPRSPPKRLPYPSWQTGSASRGPQVSSRKPSEPQPSSHGAPPGSVCRCSHTYRSKSSNWRCLFCHPKYQQNWIRSFQLSPLHCPSPQRLRSLHPLNPLRPLRSGSLRHQRHFRLLLPLPYYPCSRPLPQPSRFRSDRCPKHCRQAQRASVPPPLPCASPEHPPRPPDLRSRPLR